MSIKSSYRSIKKYVLEKYQTNLAAILVFGSANTGGYKEGISDIDLIILLKKNPPANPSSESTQIHHSLHQYKVSVHSVTTLREIIQKIQKEGSWSTFITLAAKDGAKIIYSTKEFKQFQSHLRKNPPKKSKILDYLQKKDAFELEGYFKRLSGYDLTKGISSHLRRKLQILSYLKNNTLIFDYRECLSNIPLPQKEKNLLDNLYSVYVSRKAISQRHYLALYREANYLTKIILSA